MTAKKSEAQQDVGETSCTNQNDVTNKNDKFHKAESRKDGSRKKAYILQRLLILILQLVAYYSTSS